MDVIDYELKRYDNMRNDLETHKNPEQKLKETNKSAEYLDTIMNEEKPREVIFNNINLCPILFFSDMYIVFLNLKYLHMSLICDNIKKYS